MTEQAKKERPRVLINDVILDDIARRYRAGETTADLVQAFRCSNQTIRSALRQRGVAIRKRDREGTP